MSKGLFSLTTPFETFRLEKHRSGTTADADQKVAAARALVFLRERLESGDARAILLVRRLLDDVVESGETSFVADDAPSAAGASPFQALEPRELARRLERELDSGRIVVEKAARRALPQPAADPLPDVPQVPPPRPSGPDTLFDLRFVDEIGQAIGRLSVEFDADGRHEVTTNAGGVALLENVVATSATATAFDPVQLEKILAPRWETRRPGAAPRQSNTVEVTFLGAELEPLTVKPVAPHTVIVKPPLGRIFVELRDKTGRSRHAGVDYTIDGAESLKGKTTPDGRLSHEGVFPGDYTLAFSRDFFDGADLQTDSFTTPVVVQELEAPELQVRFVGAVPRVVLARVRLSFNTNKSFVLPTMLTTIGRLREIYVANDPSKLLVVGHADTTGGPEVNDPLSLDRARSTIAYLKDDVDAWLAFFGPGVPEKRRWGKSEIRMMIVSMPDFVTKPKGMDAVEWFQRTRGLFVDGVAGPDTRRALVTEYMMQDGVSLEEQGFEIDAVPHGCGENFPLDDSGESLDDAPEDAKPDPVDRRVELYFFDSEFGIVPAPPGDNSAPGSPEYPAWRKRLAETHELEATAAGASRVTFVELVDGLFRTNSAVVLPEAEDPKAAKDESADPASGAASKKKRKAVGIIATALRFNDEHPGKTVLVAGHTDTEGSTDFNQTLSKERSDVGLALLLGGADGRSAFQKTCNGRHAVADYKQILAAVARDLADLGFDCDPGKIDDDVSTADRPVRRFQQQYNARLTELGASAAIGVDGSVGEETWGAFFDCYELGLRRELGEDADGVSKLRKKLTFADPDRRALGFGEHFPIEELGVDEFDSQSNRRVEIVFFDKDEDPDLVHAENDPETSELYLPGHFERTSVPSMPSGKRSPYVIKLDLDEGEIRGEKVRFRVRFDGEGFEQVLAADAAEGPKDGFLELTFSVPPVGTFTLEMLVEGVSPIRIFERVPFTALTTSPTPSAFEPTPRGEPVEPTETIELRDVYERSGELL